MKVVIFIDVQNDFIDGSLPVDKDKAVTEKIRKYASICNAEHVPLFATRDTHGEDYLETFEGKRLPVEHCIKGTHGWELDAGLAALVPASNRVNKNTFGSGELSERLRYIDDCLGSIYGEGITEIELCGFCASICVISNALLLRADYPDMKITVLKNLCGDVNEESLEAAMTVAKNCQIDVANAVV